MTIGLARRIILTGETARRNLALVGQANVLVNAAEARAIAVCLSVLLQSMLIHGEQNRGPAVNALIKQLFAEQRMDYGRGSMSDGLIRHT